MLPLKHILKHPFYRFLALSGLCYMAWFIGYDLFLREEGTIDDILGSSTAVLSVKVLCIIGYKASYIKDSYGLIFFFNDGQKLLQMVPACNGQVLYPLFIGFIIATPGYLKDKIRIILSGSIVIFLINTVRVVGLCLIKINSPQHLAFNHKYTFTVVVYGCIFAMWMLWIKRFVPKTVK